MRAVAPTRSATISERVTHEPTQWLLLSYREPEAGVWPIGIVLYVPATDELFVRLREDFPFVRGEDREILTGTSASIIAIADDHGKRAAFNWISDTLSNAIFAEGPYTVSTQDPRQTLAALFEAKVDASPQVDK
jgi:hypothetical protein